jgi:hypothetical protein
MYFYEDGGWTSRNVLVAKIWRVELRRPRMRAIHVWLAPKCSMLHIEALTNHRLSLYTHKAMPMAVVNHACVGRIVSHTGQRLWNHHWERPR